jgi:hypothetical protein
VHRIRAHFLICWLALLLTQANLLLTQANLLLTQAKQPARQRGNRRLTARGVVHHHRTRVDQAVYRERDQASSPTCPNVRPHQLVGVLIGRLRGHRRDAEHSNRR